jgi:hypothetical protein
VGKGGSASGAVFGEGRGGGVGVRAWAGVASAAVAVAGVVEGFVAGGVVVGHVGADGAEGGSGA